MNVPGREVGNSDPARGWEPDGESVRYAYGLAFRFLPDPDQAGDLAQDALLSAWRSRATLADPAAARAWLRRIVLNAFLMRLRSASLSRETEFPDGDPAPYADLRAERPGDALETDEAIGSVRNGCFYAMMRNLTAEQRCAFVLVDMAGLDAAEASSLLGLGVGAFRALLHRARANLNAFFGDHCSLVRPENPCSCESWSRLAADREALRSAVASRGGPPPFGDPAYAARGDPATAPRVLALFGVLPDRLPPPAWFERAGAELAALRAEKKP